MAGLEQIPPIGSKAGKCITQFGLASHCPFWQDATRSIMQFGKNSVCAWRPFSTALPLCEVKTGEIPEGHLARADR